MAEAPDARKPSNGFHLYGERVSEGNWEWLRAEGYRPHQTLPEDKLEYSEYSKLSQEFGSDNVREGDVFDSSSDRPLRHIPGMTIYVRDEPPVDDHQQSTESRT